jgi:hypothetical protein
MATSPRAQELANQLLDLEATRAPLPVEKRRFQGMNEVKAFIQKNKKAVTVAAVIAGAVVIFAGYKAYQKKHENK